jgi:NADH:ubiquinone oxidoreductase subunit C
VYVIDMTGRVQVFDRDGSYLRGSCTPDGANGTPTRKSFNPRGLVRIRYTHYNRIQRVRPEAAG